MTTTWSTFERVKDAGTGQRCCKTPQAIQVELQNTQLTRYEADAFVQRVGMAKKVQVIFDIPDSKQRQGCEWGIATLYADPHTFQVYPNTLVRIRLFRYSVSTFLHELAHAMTGFKRSRDGRCLAHHKEFGENLDKLFEEWLKWKEV